MEYKDTLNLPKTKFSMKANLQSLEPKILGLWNELNIYHRIREERKNSEKFILHDGPPYANGAIHIGHALNKILKDIVIKYKILKGYDCPYIMGWDCHGLPVEHQLFKKLKLTKHDVEITDFREKAKNYALSFVDSQKEDFKRLGLFTDWDNPYLTVNYNYEEKMLKLLESLVEQGYIYRGRKPVNWCGTCETALAEAEVEYNDKLSNSIYFLFEVINNKNVFSNQNDKIVSFLVWTTTPWTLVSNVAVAVNPEFEYNLVEYNNKLIVLCTDLISFLGKKFETEFKIIKTFTGSDLENIILKHPFLEREAKVVLADYVSKEDGSGCVHIAPGHGVDDYSLTKKYNLDIIMPINDKGLFEEPEEFKGKNIYKANELVIEKLNANGLLVKHEKIKHSYPHCWRCKKPIMFRATFQWFLKVDHKNLRQNILSEIENVNWIPSSGKERMKAMLTTRPDWCLSRQRLWGVPIPAVKCVSCHEVVLDKAIINKTAENFAKNGSGTWFSSDLENFLPNNYKCQKCGQNKFEKEYDILDVWFESGASFMSVVQSNPDLLFPADLYLEGSDQHRGWFQVSLIPSVAKENVAPYKNVLTHGFVVDGDGRKMSKSLGNVMSPQKIINTYGTEILRLWAAYTDYSEDVKISEGIIKQLTDMYRKVRNTIKFIIGNISDYDINKSIVSYENLDEVDKFMASRLAVFLKETTECYNEFSFYKACQKIFNFCNLELSSFYLDILKDRLYTAGANSKERQGSQFVLYHTLKVLLKIIAPILSFTAEEAYQCWENISDKKDSVFITPIDENFYKKWLDKDLNKRWEKILDLRSKTLKVIEINRENGDIGSSLEAEVILKFNTDDYTFFNEYLSSLKEIFIVSSVIIEKGDFAIEVKKVQGRKCMRCWNWSKSVGADVEYSEICYKCLTVLKEAKV
ncbi:MAG: isoleucine--tRNA ligase [Candidatus Omnitrophica bacterium]|nr:isoleucine--tRNA ligase [Candidatus Omnitrophota bacterium]